MPRQDTNSAPPQRTRGAQRGFALIEIALALLVIAIATLGGTSWTLSGVNLDADNRETAAMNDVMRRLLEELQDEPFDELFERFHDRPFTIQPDRKEDFLGTDQSYDGSDKSGKSGKSAAGPGPSGTSGIAYRKHPVNVHISFPTDAEGNLSETAMGPEWSSLAWDLDGNGETTDSVLSTYRVLPVRVTLIWFDSRGERKLEHVRLMTRRPRLGDDE